MLGGGAMSRAGLEESVRKVWLTSKATLPGFSRRPRRKKSHSPKATMPEPVAGSKNDYIEGVWTDNRTSLSIFIQKLLGVKVFSPSKPSDAADPSSEDILSDVAFAFIKAIQSCKVIENERAWLRQTALYKVSDYWFKQSRETPASTTEDYNKATTATFYQPKSKPRHKHGESRARLRSEICAANRSPVSDKTGYPKSKWQERGNPDPVYQEVCRRLKRAKIEAAISSLDEEKFQIIKGVLVDGNTQCQVSKETGKSAGQTARQLKKAKMKLSNKLHRLAA